MLKNLSPPGPRHDLSPEQIGGAVADTDAGTAGTNVIQFDRPHAFRTEVLHLDGVATIRLVGEWDIAGAEAFRTTMIPLLDQYEAAEITFDCSRLTFLDAVAIGQFVNVWKRAGGEKLNLVGPSPWMLRLLEMTATDELFDVRAEAPPFHRSDDNR